MKSKGYVPWKVHSEILNEMNCAISGELYTVDSYRNFSQEKKNIRQHFSFENNLMAMLLSSPFFVFVIRSSSTCATYHCSTNPPW